MSNGNKSEHGMSLIVKTITAWLKGFIFLFGVYVVVYGHLTPGGGFAGGVIVASAFVLLMLAEGRAKTMSTLSTGIASELDSVGALIFLGVALVGLLRAGVFFKNFISTPEASHFKLLSAGTMLISNMGIGLKVGMALFMVFVMLSALRVTLRDNDREMIRRGKK